MGVGPPRKRSWRGGEEGGAWPVLVGGPELGRKLASTVSFSFVSLPGTQPQPCPGLGPPLLALEPKISSGQVRTGRGRGAEGRAKLSGVGGREEEGGRRGEGPGSQEERGGWAGAPPLHPTGPEAEASLGKAPSHSPSSAPAPTFRKFGGNSPSPFSIALPLCWELGGCPDEPHSRISDPSEVSRRAEGPLQQERRKEEDARSWGKGYCDPQASGWKERAGRPFPSASLLPAPEPISGSQGRKWGPHCP